MEDEKAQTSEVLSSLPDTAYGSPKWKGDEIERTLKILVIGDIGTGKTSIIRRYVHNLFSSDYQATIGVDFALKILRWNSSTLLRLQFWDIAGQERFNSMTRVYYRGAAGALIVSDVGRASTMEGAARWKEDLNAKCRTYGGSSVPAVLMVNKCDLIKQAGKDVRDKIDQFVAKHGFAGWFPTSAKEGTGIEDAVNQLCNCIFALEQSDQLETPVVNVDTPLRLTSASSMDEERRKRKFGATLLPWTEIYKPTCPDTFATNQHVATAVQKWMLAWKARLAKRRNCETSSLRRESRSIYDDYDYIDEQESDKLANAILLYGPTGVGKTEIVHAMAKLCGLKVIEISTSTNRAQTSLERTLSEAAESYRMSWREETACSQLQTPEKNRKRKREDIRSFFASNNIAIKAKKRPPSVNVEIVSPAEVAYSVILFDDADIVLHMDSGFHVLMGKLLAKSRTPIAITCSDANPLGRALEQFNITRLQVQPPSFDDLLIHCKLILLANDLSVKDERHLSHLVRCSNGDWRKCLLNLQFAGESYGPTTCESKITVGDQLVLDDNEQMNEITDRTGYGRLLSPQGLLLLEHYPQLETFTSLGNITVDYLPYARQMALIDSQSCSKVAENGKTRQLSYFGKICIDDKDSSLRKELTRHIFQTHTVV
ncbi:hypothetical protein M513_06653 [Trichuris suis]|uniref:AAA+ ATPase domain-containing protein n=1 Tax=Trichuris suis TaxID=68888 RepID=A0A085M5G0_9BILA|nr:hypothetical protein M513_06653 [Trichuris suis]